MSCYSKSMLLVIGGLLTLGAAGADDVKVPPKEDAKSVIMKKKLAQAQKVLEGLALEDFAKIKSGADELADLRKQAAFRVRNTLKYELHSNEFQRHIESLQKAAKNKNLDAAALAYVEMTLNCVRCHQYVRDEGIARIPALDDLNGLAGR